MDSEGNLLVRFTEEMNTNFSEKFLNEDFIKISIVEKDYDYGEDEEPFNKNLTWEVSSFKDKILNISITFEDPTQISIGKDLDVLVFEALNSSEIF